MKILGQNMVKYFKNALSNVSIGKQLQPSEYNFHFEDAYAIFKSSPFLNKRCEIERNQSRGLCLEEFTRETYSIDQKTK